MSAGKAVSECNTRAPRHIREVDDCLGISGNARKEPGGRFKNPAGGTAESEDPALIYRTKLEHYCGVMLYVDNRGSQSSRHRRSV